MRSELTIKTRSLGGTSDLTLLAPIKPGLVPSLESVTYKTRVKRLLATLNAGRTSSHEYSLLRPFSDAVERVGKIHSVRVAIIEPASADKPSAVILPPSDDEPGREPAVRPAPIAEPGAVLLSVTFDGGEESYLRVLWQKVGILLDLIFCNTQDYRAAYSHPFEEWANWVRGVQIETDFFYGMPGHTVEDVQYLRKEEGLHRRLPGQNSTDLLATRQAVQSAEEIAWSRLNPPRPHILKEVGRQGLRALALVYRLTAYYLPGTLEGKGDGDILHRAARDLLGEFILLESRRELEPVISEGRKRFDEQITWLLKKPDPRKVPELPREKPQPDNPRDVQAGIINPYPDGVTHGCLLLVAFPNRAAAKTFLEDMAKHVTHEAVVRERREPFVSLSLTNEGLRAIGLSEQEMELFPHEFREGMEARASVLGDLRTNHPRRWKLPLRNCGPRGVAPAAPDSPAVELSSVHAIVQIRVASGEPSFGETLGKGDPLLEIIAELRAKHRGVDFLSVQPMVRHFHDKERKVAKEHFGFADGNGQPVLDPNENGQIYNRNQVQLGELLLGYDNEAETAEDQDRAIGPERAKQRRRFLHNGSFLVIRKLAQDVKALEDALKRAATGLDKELVLAKMMGRWRSGDPLARPGGGNDFDYVDEDPPGSLCPFHAHIRRANPRGLDNPDLPVPPGRRTPRLMRRGMSYGPLYNEGDPATWSQPRGLIFMAYNTSIAEQFEVVQRWLSGGNSAGGFSGQSDPFLGVPAAGERKWFSFERDQRVYQIPLDGTDAPLGDPRPFVRLEWGIYLFTPSISALQELAEIADKPRNAHEALPWSAEAGTKRIRTLLDLPMEDRDDVHAAITAWKAALEDPDAQRYFDSAGIWAAIRDHRNGVLRTPYGVIVAKRTLIDQVLMDTAGYSVSGYRTRMLGSIGEIYLGLDDDGPQCPYHKQSDRINTAIGELSNGEAFTAASEAATKAIDELVADEQAVASAFGEPRWELNLDIKEIVDKALIALSQKWLGLPADADEIKPGGARWDWKSPEAPFYPGHFTAPSRYFFQPNPTPRGPVEDLGKRYGLALREAFTRLITRHRDGPSQGVGKDLVVTAVTKEILDTFPRASASGGNPDEPAARAMVGVLMGFLPTLDGNLRLSLNEMLRDGSFWTLRGKMLDDPSSALPLIEHRLKKAMQLRPSPELIWRTAKVPDGTQKDIGGEPLENGDTVVLAIVSATQEHLGASSPADEANVFPIFGGARSRTSRHPTHACPGYQAAMAALLGVVSALMGVKDAMRPSVAPLALTLEGDTPQPPQTGETAPQESIAPLSTLPAAVEVLQRPIPAPPAPVLESDTSTELKPVRSGGARISRRLARAKNLGTGHVLVADGDSWFSYSSYGPFGTPQNIAAYLETQYDFKVETLASLGTRLFDFYADRSMGEDVAIVKPVASSPRLDRLVAKVKRLIATGRTPTAILLSAAGNDVVEDRLAPLLKKNVPNDPLEDLVVKNTVDVLMRRWLEKVLERITTECVSAPNTPIPVFIHGYDFPVPDCRYVAGQVWESKSWLYRIFKAKEYEKLPYENYPGVGTPIMKTLITRLNDMQADVASTKFKGRVFHVKLTGTLSNLRGSYVQDWNNELHPSVVGFTALTQKFVEELVKNIPALQKRS